MRNKIIATAVAVMASNIVIAQTAPAVSDKYEMRFYGYLDAGIEVADSDIGVGSKTRVQSGQGRANRLGIEGKKTVKEDTAFVYRLEAGFNLDNGTNASIGTNTTNTSFSDNGGVTATSQSFISREAYGGLEGSWGRVVLGRMSSPMMVEMLKSDIMGLITAASGGNQLVYVPGFGIRYNNLLNYVSPSFGGFTAGIAASSGSEQNVSSAVASNGKLLAVSGSYDKGPIHVGLVVQQVTTGLFTTPTSGAITLALPTVTDTGGSAACLQAGKLSATAAAIGRQGTVASCTFANPTLANSGAINQNVKAHAWLLGGSYNFGSFKVSGMIDSGSTTDLGSLGKVYEGKGWHLGVSVPFAKGHEVALAYAVGQADTILGMSVADGKAKTVGIRYRYELDSATTVYVAYAREEIGRGSMVPLFSNQTLALTSIAPSSSGSSPLNTLPGSSPSVLQIGAYYKF